MLLTLTLTVMIFSSNTHNEGESFRYTFKHSVFFAKVKDTCSCRKSDDRKGFKRIFLRNKVKLRLMAGIVK